MMLSGHPPHENRLETEYTCNSLAPSIVNKVHIIYKGHDHPIPEFL